MSPIISTMATTLGRHYADCLVMTVSLSAASILPYFQVLQPFSCFSLLSILQTVHF